MKYHFVWHRSLVFGLLGLLLASCSRTVEKPANIVLQIPTHANQKSGASASSLPLKLRHLMLNVENSGQTIFRELSWEKSQESATDNRPSTPGNIEVLVKPGILKIQVLAIFNEEGSESEIFYYNSPLVGQDESTSNYVCDVSSSSVVECPIQIMPIDLGLAVGDAREGRVVGRYLTSATDGPTGEIIMKYKANAARPAMIINKSEIFGGYFNIFMLNGAPFQYSLADGTPLFGGAIDLSSAALDSPSTARFNVPAIYRTFGGGGDVEYREKSQVVVGHFESSQFEATPSYSLTTGKGVCYPSGAFEVPYSYLDDLVSVPLNWVDVGSDTDLYSFPIVGGATESDESDGLCEIDGYSRYADYMSFDPKTLANHDESAGFRGPFVTHQQSGSDYRETFVVDYDGTNLNLNWEYLPGTLANGGVVGADVFYRILGANQNLTEDDVRVNDGLKCGELTSQYGFHYLIPAGDGDGYAGEIDGDANGSLIQSRTVSSGNLPIGFSAAYNNDKLRMALCPYTFINGVKRYFKSGQFFRNYNDGGSPLNSFQLKMVGFNGSTNVPPARSWMEGACATTGYKIQLVDGMGNPVLASGDLEITLESMSGMVEFASPCGDPSMPSITIFDGASETAVFYLSGDVGDYDMVKFWVDGQSHIYGSLSVTAGINSVSPDELIVTAPMVMASGSCYPIEVGLLEVGMPAVFLSGGSTQVTVSLMNSLAGTLYQDPNCSMPGGPTFTIPQGVDRVFFSFKPTSIVSGGEIEVSASGNVGSISMPAVTPVDVGGNTVEGFRIEGGSLMGPTSYQMDVCTPLYIARVNDIGADIRPNQSMAIDVSIIGGTSLGRLYSSESSCQADASNTTGTATLTGAIGANEWNTKVYMKLYTGSPEIEVAGPGGIILSSEIFYYSP